MTDQASKIVNLFTGKVAPDEVTQNVKLAVRHFASKLDDMMPGWSKILPSDSPLLKRFQSEAVEAASRFRSEIDSAIENKDWDSARVLADYIADRLSRDLGSCHDETLESRLICCRLLAEHLEEPEVSLERAKHAIGDLDESDRPNHRTVPEFCRLIVQVQMKHGLTSESLPFLNRGIAVALELGLEQELSSLIELRSEATKLSEDASGRAGRAPGGEVPANPIPGSQQSTNSPHQLLFDLVGTQLPQPQVPVDELLNGLTGGLDQLLESTTLAAARPVDHLARFVTEELKPACHSLGDSGAEVWQLVHDRATRGDAARVSTTVLFLSSVFSQFRDVSVEDMVLLVVATVDLLTLDE